MNRPFNNFNINFNNNNHHDNNNINHINDDNNEDFNLFHNNIHIIYIPGLFHFDNRGHYFNDFYDEDINYSIDRNFGNLYKSANNEFYNSWFPIYISDENFEKNKITILNYFSIVKFGNSGAEQFDFQPQYIFEILINLLSGMIMKIIEKNISSSFLKCFFQYILMFKKLEKRYNNIFIEYQKLYFDNFIKQLTKPKIDGDIKKEYFETLTLFLLSDNDTKLAINAKIKNYAKYKNFIFLKLFENKKIDDCIEVDLLLSALKRLNLFDIIFQYFYEHLFSTREKLLSLLKYDIIKDKFKNIIKKMQFTNFYHSLNSKIKQKINVLLFTKLNFSNYINDFRINLKINQNILSVDNIYKIASKLKLLNTKIFNENVLDKLEENLGIYLDSANLIEELKSEIKIKNKEKILKKNDFIPLIEVNSYYSLYKKCNEGFSKRKFNYTFDFLDDSLAQNLNSFENISEESLYKEIIDIFYTYKKKKINKIREIKINEKEKIKRDKTITKNYYEKINNARLNKYINKKNITRLLLCKRNYY